MAATDAKAIPVKNVALRVTFPIFDADGDLVTGATGLDSEVSLNAGGYTDCANEAIEIGSSGMYTLDLTAAEMNSDTVVVLVKTTSSGAKTSPIVLYTAARSINDLAYPLTSGRGMLIDAFGGTSVALVYADALNNAGVTTRAGTAQAGTGTTITLDTGASAIDGTYTGQMAVLTTSTGAGQARLITGYVGSTKVATVAPAWVTNPSATSLFVLVPNQTLVSALGTDAITASSLAADAAAELVAAFFARTGFVDPTAPPTFASSFSSIVAYMLLWMIGEVDATTGAVTLRDVADSTDVATHVTSDVSGVFTNSAPT